MLKKIRITLICCLFASLALGGCIGRPSVTAALVRPDLSAAAAVQVYVAEKSVINLGIAREEERVAAAAAAAAEVERLKALEPRYLSNYGGKPKNGGNIGTVSVSDTSVNCDIYFGDGDGLLNAGVGIYAGGGIPGAGTTILVAGHTGSYFSGLAQAVIGADIAVETYYGTYHYTISDIQVVNEDDTSAYDLSATTENIILYTCYPFGTLQSTPYRCFVYGDYVSGPPLLDW